jgi:Bacterial regulatory proteins, tetR family
MKVARVAVAERGADVVLEDVARLAGVAIGTLYRHFYYRSSLLQIYKNGVQRFTSRVAFQTVNGCAAHMGGQVLTSEGQTRSCRKSFTNSNWRCVTWQQQKSSQIQLARREEDTATEKLLCNYSDPTQSLWNDEVQL